MINVKNDDVNNDLKSYKDNFFNIIFSDPPYNLGSRTYVDKDGKMKFTGKAQDFMNKWTFSHEDWEIFFDESFRTLKHGGFCILYGMDRQQPLIQYYAIRAGFEVQQSLYWYFISSFPKSTDLSKTIDKREGVEREVVGTQNNMENTKFAKMSKVSRNRNGYPKVERPKDNYWTGNILGAPSTDLAQKYDGWKYSISPFKQVVETIMVFKKPTKNKSVLDDVYAYEEGDKTIHPAIINIDGGRVSTSENTLRNTYNDGKYSLDGEKGNFRYKEGWKTTGGNNRGRYPSQMFLDEYCADRIDRQSGESKSSGGQSSLGAFRGSNIYGEGKDIRWKENPGKGDSGGASRINHIIPWTEEEMDLLYYEPKVSKKERNAGLDELNDKWSPGYGYTDVKGSKADGMFKDRTTIKKNVHPCLKSLSLNFKIFELFKTPDIEDVKVYVPFAGTFSEVIGILANGVKEENLYACELSEDYIEIGKARLEYWRGNSYDFKNLKTTKIQNKKEEDETLPRLF